MPVQYSKILLTVTWTTISWFRICQMMNGNVCISARSMKAYAIPRWKTCSFSWVTPVTRVIQLVLLAVALHHVSKSRVSVSELTREMAYTPTPASRIWYPTAVSFPREWKDLANSMGTGPSPCLDTISHCLLSVMRIDHPRTEEVDSSCSS